jgi:hypothetical protein
MLADQVLLLSARLLLRVCSPLDAHALMLRLGRLCPPLRSAEEARGALGSLAGRGTCLSRSLAVAARTEGAVVAIGVDPGGSRSRFAHAWVEVDGAPLEQPHPSQPVIARLKGPASRRASMG